MSDNMTREQRLEAENAELKAEVAMLAAGRAAQAAAAASAAVVAAGKKPLRLTEFNQMSALKRMKAMTSGDYQLIDDRDI